MSWLRTIAAFAFALACMCQPATSSAFVPASQEARVGAFEVVADPLVGGLGDASRGQHQGIGEAYDENASGYRFAAGGARAAAQQALRPDVVLSGGRSGQLVKSLVGPPSSAVRGGGARAFVTNEQGQVILDITAQRVKPVIPGQGFGPKRPPTTEELGLLDKILGGGQ